MPISLLNGLSQMGSGIAAFAGTAGLEQQKAQLANQSAILADQLATTRETGLEGLRQQGQAANTQAIIAGQAANTATTEAGAAARNAATIASENQRSAAQRETLKTIEQMRLSADPDDVKAAKAIQNNPSLLDAMIRMQQAKSGMGSVFTPSPLQPTQQGAETPPAPTDTGAAASDNAKPSPSAGAVQSSSAAPLPKTGKQITGAVTDVLNNPQEDQTYSPRSAIVGILQTPNPNWNTNILAQVSPEYRPRVVAMLEGREAPPPANRPNPITTGLLNAAHLIDPTFDESTWTERFKTRQSIASGPIYQNTLALNTAFGHVAQLAQEFAKEGNFSSPLMNLPANWISETVLGNASVPDARRAVDTAASEIRRALAGSAGGITELQDWQKNFPINGSPSQQVNAVKDAVRILQVRMNEMTDQVNTNLGKGIAPTRLLTPTAQKAMQYVESLGNSFRSPSSALPANTPMGGLYGGTAAPTAPTAPTATSSPADSNILLRYDAQGNRIIQ